MRWPKKIDYDQERNQLGKLEPITWLAQFLIRNHPTRALPRDGDRQRCFRALEGLALKEHGRREFFRRRSALEEAFQDFCNSPASTSTERGKLLARQIPEFLRSTDDAWCLEGELITRFSAVKYPGGNKYTSLTFPEVWEWMVSAVESARGIFPRDVFLNADRRRQERADEAEKRRIQRAKEEEARRVLEATRDIERRFHEAVAAIKADQTLMEGFDAPDYTFPKSATEQSSGGQETLSCARLRALLTMWAEVGGAGSVGESLLKPGCLWSQVLRFFNSLRNPGETDVETLEQLMTARRFQARVNSRNVQVVRVNALSASATVTVLDEITGETLEVQLPAEDAEILAELIQENPSDVFVHLDDTRLHVKGYCRMDG